MWSRRSTQSLEPGLGKTVQCPAISTISNRRKKDRCAWNSVAHRHPRECCTKRVRLHVPDPSRTTPRYSIRCLAHCSSLQPQIIKNVTTLTLVLYRKYPLTNRITLKIHSL